MKNHTPVRVDILKVVFVIWAALGIAILFSSCGTAPSELSGGPAPASATTNDSDDGTDDNTSPAASPTPEPEQPNNDQEDSGQVDPPVPPLPNECSVYAVATAWCVDSCGHKGYRLVQFKKNKIICHCRKDKKDHK